MASTVSSNSVGCKQGSTGEKGTLEIEYYNLDDLERLSDLLT